MKRLIILLALTLLVIVSACDKTETIDCTTTGCEQNQICTDTGCICEQGFIRCNKDCISPDSCCRDADCNTDQICDNHTCINPCLDITCENNLACIRGTCGCEHSLKLCNNTCIPQDSCCTTNDCKNGTMCYQNKCITLCDITSCGENEFCENGVCHCEKDTFRSTSGLCLPLGMCDSNADCSNFTVCVKGICSKNCYTYHEPIEVSECFLDQAVATKDVTLCDFVKADKQDICIFKVATAKLDRRMCGLLPAVQSLDIFYYNQQNCVIEVAKLSQNYDICKDTPKSTNLDPTNLDQHCREKVLEYIESLTILDIYECGNDCACKFRFAKRNGLAHCSEVCADDRARCLEEFYEN